ARVSIRGLSHATMHDRMPARFVGPTRLICIVVPLAALFAVMAMWLRAGSQPGDAYTYLAAGQRLNAGHQLYALSPGDNPVQLNPPYWTVPLLSPPFMAVLWRPLALLPMD